MAYLVLRVPSIHLRCAHIFTKKVGNKHLRCTLWAEIVGILRSNISFFCNLKITWSTNFAWLQCKCVYYLTSFIFFSKMSQWTAAYAVVDRKDRTQYFFSRLQFKHFPENLFQQRQACYAHYSSKQSKPFFYVIDFNRLYFCSSLIKFE